MSPTENPDPSAPDPWDAWNHSLAEEWDHEHPCPPDRCINLMRKLGYDIPPEYDCCTCYERAQKRAGHPEG